MSILVTGGAGYIGSHTTLTLLEKGYDVVVFDNLANSCEEAIKRVEKLAGKSIKFYEADMLDKDAMNKIFDENPDISAVIHFAGLKAVGESVTKPIEYYNNNIGGTLSLLEAMRAHNVCWLRPKDTVRLQTLQPILVKEEVQQLFPNVQLQAEDP